MLVPSLLHKESKPCLPFCSLKRSPSCLLFQIYSHLPCLLPGSHSYKGPGSLMLLNNPSPFVHEDEDAEFWSSAQVLFSRACINGARVRHVTQLSHQKYSCSQAGMVGHSFNPNTLETEFDVEFLTIATRTNYELSFSYPSHMDIGSRNYGCFVSFCFLLPLFSQMCVLSSIYGGRRTALGVIPPQAPFTFSYLLACLFC